MSSSSAGLVVCCVGNSLCDGLITRLEESHQLCVCLIVCDLETSTVRRPGPPLGQLRHRKKEKFNLKKNACVKRVSNVNLS